MQIEIERKGRNRVLGHGFSNGYGKYVYIAVLIVLLLNVCGIFLLCSLVCDILLLQVSNVVTLALSGLVGSRTEVLCTAY